MPSNAPHIIRREDGLRKSSFRRSLFRRMTRLRSDLRSGDLLKGDLFEDGILKGVIPGGLLSRGEICKGGIHSRGGIHSGVLRRAGVAGLVLMLGLQTLDGPMGQVSVERSSLVSGCRFHLSSRRHREYCFACRNCPLRKKPPVHLNTFPEYPGYPGLGYQPLPSVTKLL